MQFEKSVASHICAAAISIVAALLPMGSTPSTSAAEPTVSSQFERSVQPLLSKYCYDCHADGMDKGKVAFDGFKSQEELFANHDLWLAVIKNVRAGIMPPAKKDQPTAEEKEILVNWVKYGVFDIDPADPDPGRVTLRRLNRVEYRNTIRDLMGIDFNTTEEFPPDDTGYGFDTIGDVLSISPLLLDKYLQAAEKIVSRAVPTVSRVVDEKNASGRDFKGEGANGQDLTFYKEATVSHTTKVDKAGEYRVFLDLNINGAFDFDPGKATAIFSIDGEEVFKQDLAWEDNKKIPLEFSRKWEPGEHKFTLELKPLVPVDQKKTSIDLRINSLRIQGPMEKALWTKTKNYDRFFPKDDVPEGKKEKRQYAREILESFGFKAYRRPLDSKTLDRLVALAEESYNQPGKKFEEGISQAMIAILASPRFLFRVEETEPASKDPFASIDEYALASRLSYFLWSTMPDEELFRLARAGELRQNLPAQVQRILKDSRSKELVENFAGQWLQVRDIEGIAINERAIFAREMEKIEDPEERRRRRREPPKAELTGELRRSMQRETEMYFANILKEDRSVLELIDSDYTFLDERLAKHYGIPDVNGKEMRKVDLPAESPRGGILTQGTVLVVTSNPTRTSPVKRGLFLLDNFLGTPPPPPPPDLPELEESEKKFTDHEPTLREVLHLHQDKPLCSSCHNRMDPLGFAFENFNALGMWREMERGQEIDASGKLITGETFTTIPELKTILATDRRADFYRCLTEKVLTYALGRGMEYYDVETVDQIVARLDKEGGKFSALLLGVIESAPFQKRRNLSGVADAGTRSSANLAQTTKGNHE